MLKHSVPFPKNSLAALSGLAVAAFIAMIALFPGPSMQAALKGITIWWDVLFPALFPFLVISEIMLGVGVVHFLGTLLDPMMRPLFRVPGIGGFVMAIGFAAGYPVGSKLTAQLRQQGLVNRVEGERLIAFTTTADPIFIIGAVAIGFFHHTGIALLLVTAHYGSAVLLGLAMRFYQGNAPATPAIKEAIEEWPRQSLFVRALRSMHEARIKDGRSLGMLLQDAVRVSLPLILVIGGLVVFFSTVMEMLTRIGLLELMTSATSAVLAVVGLPEQLAQAVVSGLFEVTLGAQAAGTAASTASMRDSAAVAALVLSWGGLSVHAQIVSLISSTDMRYKPFLFARLAHGVFAGILLYVTWPLLQPNAAETSIWFDRFGNVTADPLSFAVAALQWGGMVLIAVLFTVIGLYAVYRIWIALRNLS